jgi:hypothetical protein
MNGQVRAWFRGMRTIDARENLERFLRDGNDGCGHVYFVSANLPTVWFDAKGWANYQAHGRLVARRWNELEREPRPFLRMMSAVN